MAGCTATSFFGCFPLQALARPPRTLHHASKRWNPTARTHLGLYLYMSQNSTGGCARLKSCPPVYAHACTSIWDASCSCTSCSTHTGSIAGTHMNALQACSHIATHIARIHCHWLRAFAVGLQHHSVGHNHAQCAHFMTVPGHHVIQLDKWVNQRCLHTAYSPR